jgi:hypothetical protein
VSLTERVHGDLKTAMKARQGDRVSLLRMLLNDLNRAALDHDQPLADGDELAVVQRAVKQRKESADAFAQGNRPDLAERERAEAEMLRAYLPQELSDEELAQALAELMAETGASGPRDLGKVMGPLMKRFPGRLDGTRARQAALKALGG